MVDEEERFAYEDELLSGITSITEPLAEFKDWVLGRGNIWTQIGFGVEEADEPSAPLVTQGDMPEELSEVAQTIAGLAVEEGNVEQEIADIIGVSVEEDPIQEAGKALADRIGVAIEEANQSPGLSVEDKEIDEPENDEPEPDGFEKKKEDNIRLDDNLGQTALEMLVKALAKMLIAATLATGVTAKLAGQGFNALINKIRSESPKAAAYVNEHLEEAVKETYEEMSEQDFDQQAEFAGLTVEEPESVIERALEGDAPEAPAHKVTSDMDPEAQELAKAEIDEDNPRNTNRPRPSPSHGG